MVLHTIQPVLNKVPTQYEIFQYVLEKNGLIVT